MLWIQWPTVVVKRHICVENEWVFQFDNNFLISFKKNILLLLLFLLLGLYFFDIELLGQFGHLLRNVDFFHFNILLLITVGFFDGNFLFNEGLGIVDELDESIPGVWVTFDFPWLTQIPHFGDNIVSDLEILWALLPDAPVLFETVLAEQEVKNPMVGSIHFQGTVHLPQEGQFGLAFPAHLLLLSGSIQPSRGASQIGTLIVHVS